MIAEALQAHDASPARIRHILVVVNCKAGGVIQLPSLPADLRRIVGSHGRVVATQRPGDVSKAIAQGLQDGVDTVALCGGDGTSRVALTALAEAYGARPWPRIALLSGGTLNTIARNLGCHAPAGRQLKRLLASEKPLIMRRPLLRVNDHVGFIFGAQTVARILAAYYERGASPRGAVLLALRMVSGAAVRSRFVRDLFQPATTDVTADGRSVGRFRFTGLVASVVPVPAVGMRVLHRATEDGGFHLIGTEQTASGILPEVGRLWVGLPVTTMSVDLVARQASMSFQEPMPFTVDGDLFAARRVDLTATAPIEVMAPGRDAPPS
jgi:diacylglycerol kinase family enzyme